MTIAELLVALERRAAEAEAIGATAPVGAVYRAVLAELEAIAGNGNGAAQHPAAGAADRWLTAAQVAELLGVSERWAYDHADQLAGRHLSRRCVRFSEAAVRRYVERRR